MRQYLHYLSGAEFPAELKTCHWIRDVGMLEMNGKVTPRYSAGVSETMNCFWALYFWGSHSSAQETISMNSSVDDNNLLNVNIGTRCNDVHFHIGWRVSISSEPPKHPWVLYLCVIHPEIRFNSECQSRYEQCHCFRLLQFFGRAAQCLWHYQHRMESSG